jgi:hypothetical protein
MILSEDIFILQVKYYFKIEGYFLKTENNGTRIIYMTRGDLKGYFPGWLVSYIASTVAPNLILKSKKLADEYGEWKKKN